MLSLNNSNSKRNENNKFLLRYNSFNKRKQIKTPSEICTTNTSNNNYLTSYMLSDNIHLNNWRTNENSKEKDNSKLNNNIMNKIKNPNVNNTLNDIYNTINTINQLNGKIKNILYNNPKKYNTISVQSEINSNQENNLPKKINKSINGTENKLMFKYNNTISNNINTEKIIDLKDTKYNTSSLFRNPVNSYKTIPNQKPYINNIINKKREEEKEKNEDNYLSDYDSYEYLSYVSNENNINNIDKKINKNNAHNKCQEEQIEKNERPIKSIKLRNINNQKLKLFNKEQNTLKLIIKQLEENKRNRKKINSKEKKRAQNMRDIILLEKYKQIELKKLENINDIKNHEDINYYNKHLTNYINRISIDNNNYYNFNLKRNKSYYRRNQNIANENYNKYFKLTERIGDYNNERNYNNKEKIIKRTYSHISSNNIFRNKKEELNLNLELDNLTNKRKFKNKNNIPFNNKKYINKKNYSDINFMNQRISYSSNNNYYYNYE